MKYARMCLELFCLCDSDEKRGGLFRLLQEVMEDAKAKAMIVEEIIDQDQQYQANVRNTLNLDAMKYRLFMRSNELWIYRGRLCEFY